jgi:ketosteroid isomerase-like protein
MLRAVSQRNVELLEGLFAGAQSLDKEAVLALLPQMISELCDPEIEWIEDPNRADARVYRGHEGVRASWERWLENFEEYGFEVESITDHGNRVLVAGAEHGRGRASGADVAARVYVVCTFRGDKILRYEEFYDEQDAVAALQR